MSIYNVDGDAVYSAYDKSGNSLTYAYAVDGDAVYDNSGERTVVFFDDFDIFDSSKWVCEVGNVRNYNTEQQCYRSENVSIEDSCLVLTAKKESYGGKNWTSGSISGQTLQSFKYGRFEAKIKFPNVVGAFGAFWMLGANFWKTFVDGGQAINNGVIWPACGEIDITETIPGNTNKAKANLWKYTGSSMGQGSSSTINIGDWNVYALEWTDEYIAAFVNDTEYKRWTFSDYTESAVQAYHLPMYMILNLAVGAAGGTPAESATEMKMYVDWVKVYTPLTA